MTDEQQPRTADPQVIGTWLGLLYGSRPGLISICSDKDGWAGQRFATDEAGIEAAARYAVLLDGRGAKGVYAQSTTLSARPAEGRGGEDLAYCLTHVWADGDFGTIGHKPGPDDLPAPPDPDAVAKVVAESGLPNPSGWAHTGGGYNPVWLLAEHQLIQTPEDRARVKAVTTGVQAVLAAEAHRQGWSWDVEVGNLDRLMKVPGTVNRKAGLERLATIGPGTGELFDLAALAAVVEELLPTARETLEQAAREKQERKARRTGASVPPPPRSRPAGLHSGDGPLDVLADLLTFRDLLEPEGWTYVGQSGGREKWLRPSAGSDGPGSAYSLICDDHVAVNWSERSDLPVGAQPNGQKLTVGTLYAHLHYGGNRGTAASDIMRAAGGHPAGAAAARLPASVLAEVRQRCLTSARYGLEDRLPPEGDAPHVDWSDLEEAFADLDEEPLNGDAPGAPPEPAAARVAGLIPQEFYAARPELAHIRQAGHSRSRSGDVALLTILTRLSGMVSHRIRADTGIAGYASLNLFGGIIGPSGIGKSTGSEVVDRLMPAPPGLDFIDGQPIGSGEGLAEMFMDTVEEETGEVRRGRGGTATPVTRKVRKQVRHNAFINIDEGGVITRLMKERSGSTLGETLRSAAVGQMLGQTNASKETSRFIPKGSYSLGLLAGFQPETVAPLFEEAAEGTPQRFLWVQVTDPSIPDQAPPWPGELTGWREAITAPAGDEASGLILITFDQAIKDELRAADLAKVRGEVPAEDLKQLDSHAPLMRVKLASLLALLAGRRHVDGMDWQLAALLWNASCATRDAVLEYSTGLRRLEQEKRTLARIEEEVRVDHAKQLAEETRTERAVERLAVRVAVMVRDGGPQTRKAVRARTAGRDKKYLQDAFAYAVLREWVAEAEGRFVPGPVPPS